MAVVAAKVSRQHGAVLLLFRARWLVFFGVSLARSRPELIRMIK